jgi:hypothetical protein
VAPGLKIRSRERGLMVCRSWDLGEEAAIKGEDWMVIRGGFLGNYLGSYLG